MNNRNIEILNYWRKHTDEKTREKFNLSITELENILDSFNPNLI